MWERFPLPRPSELQPDQGAAPGRGERGERRYRNRGLQRHAHHLLPLVYHPGRAAPADVRRAVAPRLRLCWYGRGPSGAPSPRVKPGDRVGCAVGHADWAVVRETGQGPRQAPNANPA